MVALNVALPNDRSTFAAYHRAIRFGDKMTMRKIVLAGAALAAGVAVPAQAWVSVYVETSPTAQAMIAAGGLVETFTGAMRDSFRSTFGGSGFGATFTGFKLAGADSNGNGFGSSDYGFTTNQASVKLDRAVQYLSFRTEALDGKDTMELFSNGKSLGTWNLVDSAGAAGFQNDPTRYGNKPIYVNFFTDLGFDEIRFTQRAGRFAMDDFTVNRLTGAPNFAVSNVTAVPEVQTWTMLILGFGAMGAAFRWRRRRAVAA